MQIAQSEQMNTITYKNKTNYAIACLFKLAVITTFLFDFDVIKLSGTYLTYIQIPFLRLFLFTEK